jgi:hypothetical protein
VKRIWVPYWFWEDYRNGMWKKLPIEKESVMLEQCIEFTGDYRKYGEVMMKVVSLWDFTMSHNLTNTSMNRLAFIGHCACTLEFQCPEYITRRAWKELSEQQQNKANAKAQKALEWWIENKYNYEKMYKRIRKRLETEMLRKRYS